MGSRTRNFANNVNANGRPINVDVAEFDDNKIVNDLSTLGLRVHTQENLSASNTNSASFDTFQDSTAVSNLTNTSRDANEFMSSTVFADTSVTINNSNYTASAGQGVFANTSSGAFTVTLPASPSLGDEVTIVDYAGTADTNNITVGRNSSPIMGAAEDLTISIERAGITLVYVDSTQGWLLKDK